MSIRLNKIIREFNVGIGTIVDFLREKGFEVNASPSEKITDEQYEILKKEFGADKDLRKEAEKLILGHQGKEKKAPAPQKTQEPEVIKTEIPADIMPKIKTVGKIDIEAKPEITFDDFGKLQFQVGEIIACEEVKKSRKLLCSQVKIGSQVRQIVSGIKAHYSAEEMVGKKVMVVTNLKPAKLAGILSEGMILCAEDADGNLSLMVPEKEMPAGAEIC